MLRAASECCGVCRFVFTRREGDWGPCPYLGMQSDQAPTAQVRMLDGHKKVLQGLDVGGMVTPAATHIELGTWRLIGMEERGLIETCAGHVDIPPPLRTQRAHGQLLDFHSPELPPHWPMARPPCTQGWDEWTPPPLLWLHWCSSRCTGPTHPTSPSTCTCGHAHIGGLQDKSSSTHSSTTSCPCIGCVS